MSPAESDRARRGDPLSARDREVLELVAQGLTNAAVGARLFITEDTVKSHLRRIFVKLGATNRLEAVALGYGHERRALAAEAALARVRRLAAEWGRIPPPKPHELQTPKGVRAAALREAREALVRAVGIVAPPGFWTDPPNELPEPSEESIHAG